MVRLPARGIHNSAPGRHWRESQTDKCRCGGAEGERIDRKMRERLRTVFRWADRKVRQGCFADTRRLPALHSLIGGTEKGTGVPGASTKNKEYGERSHGRFRSSARTA